jgi:hypothetical protein
VYRRLALNAEVGFNAIMHYVHYREPSGKEPNAPLSLAQVQAERLLPVLGSTNIQEVLQCLHETCRIASNSNCLPIADFTKDPRAIRA